MENSEQVTGKVKQAAGDLVDNDDLKRDGKIETRTGDAKAFVAKVGEKAEAVIDKIKHAATRD